MENTPIIIVSSYSSGVGVTTLTFNIAAALWADGYEVKIYSPQLKEWHNFLAARTQLVHKRQLPLYVPQILANINDFTLNEKSVILADIPPQYFAEQTEILSSAHTLITVTNEADINFANNKSYMDTIWNAKKNIAARGIKYLNWIVVPNLCANSQSTTAHIPSQTAQRYGFRLAAQLQYRKEYQYMNNGYSVSEMPQLTDLTTMTMADVYARREILKLTDFLWQQQS